MFDPAVAVALVIGFSAGLLLLRIKSRWCPGCGRKLRCLTCPGRPTPREWEDIQRLLHHR